MTKIKNLCVKGIRGIRTELSLPLESKSILLYGDNGSGKSSISDVIEWFFFDRIEHLSTEEIGKKGIEGLRNTFLSDDEESFVKFEFSDNNFNADKIISVNRERISQRCTNNSSDFNGYINDSQRENLILRYKDLMNFILATKTDKLNELSKIIGFSQVTDTRYAFKKVINGLNKDLKTKNFDNQINTQQTHLIEQLGHNITSDSQFLQSLNELVKPLKIKMEITKFNEIEDVLILIKKPGDSKIIELQQFYNELSDTAKNIIPSLDEIENSYDEYHTQFLKIKEDVDIIKKIVLEKLLSEGIKVIKGNVFEEDICPLCLQSKDKNELLDSLKERIDELMEIKKEKTRLDEQREPIIELIDEWFGKIKLYLKSEHFKIVDNKELNNRYKSIKNSLEQYRTELNIDLTGSQYPKNNKKLIIERDIFKQIVSLCDEKNKNINKSLKRELRFEIHSKIKLSRKAYSEIKKFKKEKEYIEKQLQTMELVYSEFVKKQKEGLETFLKHISNDVNDIYQFMHPGEKVDDIKLSLMEKNGELTGVTIEYKFFNNEVAPPHKYLSESHLNCLGIAIFITSVKAFNERNRFFILDDVISSFDTDHRKRFADLMVEELSDYQIVIMTHERDWFEYVKNVVKGKNWQINSIKWNEDKGTYVDEPFENIKNRIKKRIKEADESGLGNDLRIYIENVLKSISFHLKVKMDFQFNDFNEKRMSNELISGIKSTLNKRKCKELYDMPVFDRLLNSNFICNISSHDNPIECSIGDFKSVWQDISEIEELFLCTSCNKYVSHKYLDNVNKKIRCSCGKKEYNWI